MSTQRRQPKCLRCLVLISFVKGTEERDDVSMLLYYSWVNQITIIYCQKLNSILRQEIQLELH